MPGQGRRVGNSSSGDPFGHQLRQAAPQPEVEEAEIPGHHPGERQDAKSVHLKPSHEERNRNDGSEDRSSLAKKTPKGVPRQDVCGLGHGLPEWDGALTLLDHFGEILAPAIRSAPLPAESSQLVA